MVACPVERFRPTCWMVSLLLHAVFILFGVALLVQPVRFHVKAGETSMAIHLIMEPTPMPVAVPSPPVPAPVPPRQPVVPSIPVPLPLKPEILPKPAPVLTPAPPSVATPAKPHPPIPHAPHPVAAPAPATNQASKGVVPAEPDDLQNDPPEYPEDSRLAHEQGVVILRVDVTEAGRATSVRILQSSGFFRLDQAARRAVEHWKFHPAIRAGLAVSSEADVPVHFRLQ